MGKTIFIDDGDALNIDRVIVNMPNTKWCKVLYSCDLIDEYEDRLKADMVAMLEELKKSIEDNVYNVSAYSECLDCDVVDYEDVNEIIIEKINALKGQQDGNKEQK